MSSEQDGGSEAMTAEKERLDALGVYLINEGHRKIMWVGEIMDKVDAIIERHSPDFQQWLPGEDSMEGMYPIDREKYIYEKAYIDSNHKTITARIDVNGFLTFEKEED
jgi:hypothetical protein